jgi:sulfite exporter TauE/SafE
MNFADGILLGLSTGFVCLAYCGPVLIPFLLGENKSVAGNSLNVGLFLGGRLLAYMITGLVAGIIGVHFQNQMDPDSLFLGLIYVLLSLLLIGYGFYRFREICLGAVQKKFISKYLKNIPVMVPVAGGILTGLNICPPFLMAFTRAAAVKNIEGGMIYFIFFFIGTSIYFIPMPFLGLLRKFRVLRAVGKFAAIIAGFIYLYQGILMTLRSGIKM